LLIAELLNYNLSTNPAQVESHSNAKTVTPLEFPRVGAKTDRAKRL